MAIFAIIFWLVLSIFPVSVASNFSSAESKGRDTVRKNDINSIYQKLEEHYNEYGDYPTEEELTKDIEVQLPGLDIEAVIDPNEVRINQGGDYTYAPTGCTAIGCATYTLSSVLESGEIYSKTSLN
ncbi:MAG: hypothetical protein Q7T41_02865 [Candidatus Saccharibacteria bacterium]|nr:hypothetical protein [Candidatus Saccharibacteria bacterium]